MDKIYINILGEGPVVIPNNILHKAEIYKGNLIEFETTSINKVRRVSEEFPNSKLLYLNTRGVSYTGDKRYFVDRWSELLEYFNITHFYKCLEALKTHDTCSAILYSAPLPHYSGNMWWANTNYLKTLPYLTKETSQRTKFTTTPLTLDEQIFGIARHDSEFWLLQQEGVNGLSLFNPRQGMCLYTEEVSREEYQIFN